MKGFNRWLEYGIGIAVALGMFWASVRNGDAMSLSFVKAASAPLLILAMRGVALSFVSDASRTPWTFPFLERHALHALVWGCFWLIFIWEETTTAQRALAIFAFMFFAWFCAMIASDLFRRSRER